AVPVRVRLEARRRPLARIPGAHCKGAIRHVGRIAFSKRPSHPLTEDIAMERNHWKLATIGIALTGVTALSTGLTTAWMLRQTTEAQAQATPAPTVRPATQYVATVSPSTPRAYPAVARSDAPAPVTRVDSKTAADCITGGVRVLRIVWSGSI